MSDIDKYDDPLWEYIMVTKLQEYIAPAREFWEHIADIQIDGTGVYPIKQGIHVSCHTPPGFMYRVTNTPVRSPIKNVQVFPFVPTTYLQITNVSGGYTRMVSKVCADNKFVIEEFTIVEKSNLPSTYHQGQFVAFIPTSILNNAKKLGKWVYLTVPEMIALTQDQILPKVKEKVIRYI